MIRFRRVPIATVLALTIALGLTGAPPAHGQESSTRVRASEQSLYADPVAREPGDVITVVINEQTSGQRESSYEGNSSSSLDGSGSGTLSESISGSFSAGTEVSSETENSNESVQSEVLNGTFTARVTGVSTAGNLEVTGERRLTIDGVTHVMEVSGVVRPSDVRQDNTILSTQIANARITYGEEGFRHRGVFSKGLLLKVGGVVATGIGIFLGIQ
ncbi:flagellar basal body L-ring protein FlgH [Salinibacter altiplanensis]|uniref:flagellar basal body L-ring protein FlgH n=1 Tax=Salinibacter altiplanensis TaxID=1803181 RepID=UPI000C9ED761|nr:flagellar basal body L-ring protein FlgH [Salinibacter altiplanensis]